MASNDIWSQPGALVTGSFELMPRQVEKEGKDEKVDKEIKESTEKESKEKIDNMEKESGKMDKESEFADIPQTEKEAKEKEEKVSKEATNADETDKEAKEKEEKVSKETTTEEEFGQGDLIDSNDALDAWLAEQEEGTVLLPPLPTFVNSDDSPASLITGCGWPTKVEEITLTYRYELLTAGFVPRDGDNEVVSALNEEIPTAAEEVLGIQPCNQLERRSRNLRQSQEQDRNLVSNDFESYGILQIKSEAKAELDFEAGGCSSETLVPRAAVPPELLNQISCTPLKGQAKVTYDPTTMYVEQAYLGAAAAIAAAMAADPELVTSNVVGLEFVVDDLEEELEEVGSNEIESNTNQGTTNNQGTTFGALTQSEQGAIASSNKMTGGGVAGLVVAMLLLVALIVAVIVRRRRNGKDDQFEEMSAAESELQVEVMDDLTVASGKNSIAGLEGKGGFCGDCC